MGGTSRRSRPTPDPPQTDRAWSICFFYPVSQPFPSSRFPPSLITLPAGVTSPLSHLGTHLSPSCTPPPRDCGENWEDMPGMVLRPLPVPTLCSSQDLEKWRVVGGARSRTKVGNASQDCPGEGSSGRGPRGRQKGELRAGPAELGMEGCLEQMEGICFAEPRQRSGTPALPWLPHPTLLTVLTGVWGRLRHTHMSFLRGACGHS